MTTKICLITLLLALCGPATAEWTKVGESDGTTFYIDGSTFSRSFGTVKFWRLADSPKGEIWYRTPYRSSKAQVEADCLNKRWRTISVSLHTDEMGEGKVVYTSSIETEWLPVRNGSVIATLFGMACK